MTVVDDGPEYLRDSDWHLLDDDHAYLLEGDHESDDPIGIIAMHRRPDNGDACWGSVLWKKFGDHPCWQLVSLEPLHLEPSLACSSCGSHGWIRAGKWISA